MTSAQSEHFYGFRTPFNEPIKEAPILIPEDEADEKAPEANKYILCRYCHQKITTESQRIKVQGSHEHTFANPHGLLFEIGCFGSASGCEYIGPPSNEFSWFKGYRWRVAICGKCNIHNGWFFISSGEDHFWGLILNRLLFLSEQR